MSTTDTNPAAANTAADIGKRFDKTAERLNVLGLPADSVDVPAYDQAVGKLVKAVPDAIKKDAAARAAKVNLGMLFLDVRQTIKLPNGQPDTFGTTNTYRLLFDTAISDQVKETYPNLERSQIRDLLDDVRKNYLNENPRRKGKGQTYQRILAEAVASGQIKDAEAEETDDGRLRVVIRPTRKVKDEDGNETIVPVMEKVRQTVTAEDGTEKVETVEVPKVVTYVTGNPDAPPAVKTALKKVIQERGRKNQVIPDWVGGPSADDKETPGPKKDNPVNMAAAFQKALEGFTANLSAVALASAGQWIHGAVTVYVDDVNGTKGGFAIDPVADALEGIAALCKAEAAFLRNKDASKSDALRAKVEEHRYVPETGSKATTKVDEAEAEAEAEQEPSEADLAEAEQSS